MRILPAMLVFLAAPASAAPTQLPWLANLENTTVASSDERTTTLPFDLDPEGSCYPPAYSGLTLTTDLGPPAGAETIVGSFARGVVVVGADAERVAVLGGFPCQGTADELEFLAVGRAWNERMVAIAVTTGGRREASTWLGLYRVGLAGFEPVFSGIVETYEDGVVRTGQVTIVPGGLFQREPSGEMTWWGFERGSRALQPHPLGPTLPGA